MAPRGGGGVGGREGKGGCWETTICRNEGTVSVLQGSLPMEIMIENFPHFSVCRLIGAVAWLGVRWGRILWLLCSVLETVFFNPIFCVPPDWSSGVAWCALRPYFAIFVLHVWDRIFFNPIFCVLEQWRGVRDVAVFCDFCASCLRPYFP